MCGVRARAKPSGRSKIDPPPPDATTQGTLANNMLSVAAALATILPNQTPAAPMIVPRPVHIAPGKGSFQLAPTTQIYGPDNIVRLAQSALAPATGFEFRRSVAVPETNAIIFKIVRGDAQSTPEGYRLNADPKTVTITATTEAGLFYGLQTLRQLLPADINRKAPIDAKQTWQIPGITVDDHPRFKWRGLMIDVARHFMPKEDVLKFIDLAAYHKLNSVHIHLTDDQGWRVEIKKYPKLTEIGAFRKETVVGRNTAEYDGKPHGGFYTQADLKEIVAYAKARYVDVVPEIDMPGHMQAAFAAYPELGDDKQYDVFPRWGVNPHVLNTKPATIQFCKDVLSEIMDVFPSKFIHVGGDECPKTQWENDPYEQQKIKDLGLKDEHELQSWFIRQMDNFLVSRGRRLIGWDEILEGGLAENATVMSWRGVQGGVTASKMGHDVVMSPTSHLYLDYLQANQAIEPLGIGGFLPLEKVYSFNPVTPEIPADKAHHILGLQGNLWSEYIKEFKHMEYMAYPRACAIAEIGWTPQEDRDYADFLKRLTAHYSRLQTLDVNYRRPTVEDIPAATWKSGDTSDTWVTKEWDITAFIKKSGQVKVRFQFTGGEHRLDIQWAELLVNGNPVARDEHEGRTGGETVNNVYTFSAITLPNNPKVTLRASVRSDGGNDSNGRIFVQN